MVYSRTLKYFIIFLILSFIFVGIPLIIFSGMHITPTTNLPLIPSLLIIVGIIFIIPETLVLLIDFIIELRGKYANAGYRITYFDYSIESWISTFNGAFMGEGFQNERWRRFEERWRRQKTNYRKYIRKRQKTQIMERDGRLRESSQ